MIFVTRKIAQDQGVAVGPNDGRPDIIQPMQMDNLHTFRGDNHKISVFFFGGLEKKSHFLALSELKAGTSLKGKTKSSLQRLECWWKPDKRRACLRGSFLANLLNMHIRESTNSFFRTCWRPMILKHILYVTGGWKICFFCWSFVKNWKRISKKNMNLLHLGYWEKPQDKVWSFLHQRAFVNIETFLNENGRGGEKLGSKYSNVKFEREWTSFKSYLFWWQYFWNVYSVCATQMSTGIRGI